MRPVTQASKQASRQAGRQAGRERALSRMIVCLCLSIIQFVIETRTRIIFSSSIFLLLFHRTINQFETKPQLEGALNCGARKFRPTLDYFTACVAFIRQETWSCLCRKVSEHLWAKPRRESEASQLGSVGRVWKCRCWASSRKPSLLARRNLLCRHGLSSNKLLVILRCSFTCKHLSELDTSSQRNTHMKRQSKPLLACLLTIAQINWSKQPAREQQNQSILVQVSFSPIQL